MRTTRRHRRLRASEPKDTREIVVVQGKVLTCDEFKAGAEIRMMRHDALPGPGFRALCNEFNLHAGDVADLARQGASADDVRRRVERKLARRN